MKNLLLLAAVASMSFMADATVQNLAPQRTISANSAAAVLKKVDDTVYKLQPVKSLGKTSALSNKLATNNAVRPLADGDLSASYAMPNLFYFTFSTPDEAGNYYTVENAGTYTIGPAFTPITWANTSVGATQYSWAYLDPANDYADAVSTNQDLTVSYTYAQVPYPTLTATNDEGATSEYTAGEMAMFGGQAEMQVSETEIVPFNSGIIDSYLNESIIAGIMKFQGSIYLDRFSDASFVGAGMYIPKRESTYAISQLFVQAVCQFPAGTQLTADIYSVDDEGYFMPEPIATAVFEAESDYNDVSGQGYYSSIIPFTVQESDGIISYDSYVNVNTGILIVFKGLEQSDVAYFEPLMYVSTDVNAEDHCVAMYNYQNQLTVNSFGIYFDENQNNQADEGDTFPVGLTVSFDATFGWLFPADETSVPNNVVSVPTNGGSVTIPFNSYAAADYIEVTEDVNYDGTLSDWATYTLEENASTGTIDLTIDVTALPSDVEGRTCTCTLVPYGADTVTLTIAQGTTSGVESVVATSAAKVTVEGGNFVVNAPETINGVTVYNVAGQAVAASEIAGTTTVDASSLAKGVYVLRFNDGSTVKVIK